MVSKICIIKQYGAAFAGTVVIMSVMSAKGWTSPSLPKLLAADSPIPISNAESSWIAAMMVLGSLVSPIPGAYIADILGRKLTLLFAGLPLAAAWILVGCSHSVQMLYISRFLCGLSSGISYSIAPMYLGEIASDGVRGSIGTLLTVMAKFGILFVYSIGPYVKFYTLPWILIALPVLFILTFSWVPESPYFLVNKSKEEKAKESLTWFKGKENVDFEMEKIKTAIEKSRENKGTIKELLSYGNRKSLIIVIGLASAQQLCGSQAIIAYAELFFTEVGGDLRPQESAIILAVVQLISALASSSIVDRLGRRPLLIFSTFGVAICLTVIGTYFLFVHLEYDMQKLSIIPMIAITIYYIVYSIGLATVPFAIMAEVFPTNIKALASATFPLVSSALGFAILKLYQIISDGLGIFVTIYIFAICSYFFIFFVWYLIPETKGKPLALILEEMGVKVAKKDNL